MRLLSNRISILIESLVQSGWRRSALALALGGAGAAVAVAVVVTLLVLNLRTHAIEDRMAELASATLMLSAHADSALQAIESVQTGVIDQMRSADITTEQDYIAQMSTADIQRTLQDRVSALPYVNAVTLINRDGDLLNFSRFWPIPKVNIADRDYFKSLRSNPNARRVVSEPVKNRGTGTWTVYIGRRFEAPSGDFLGVVLGAIELSYFQRFFAEVAPDRDAVIALFRKDGIMLLHHPLAEQSIGRTLPVSGAGRLLMEGASRGTIRAVSPVDRQDRLVAIHELVHYPIVVSMSRTVAATLLPWRRQLHFFIGVALLIDVSIGGLVVLGMRHLRNRHLLAEAVSSRAEAQADRAAAEQREQHGRRLAAHYRRFDTAVSNMSQGLGMFDAADRLIISNPRLAEMFGLPATVLAAGTPLAAAVRAAIRSRSVSVQDIRFVRTELAALPETAQRGSLVWDLADGRSLAITFEKMIEQGWLMTFADMTERRQTEAQIAYMAHHDVLTGLPNRVLFHDKLIAAVGLAARGGRHGVLCLDLDHFKDVNDTLGHPIGDALLRAVTFRFRRCVREVDSVARLGGDEFAIILGAAQHPSDVVALAERLIEEISLPYEVDGHQLVIGVSIGIALTPDDGLDPDALLKNADLALYKAKAEGRGCYRFFRPEMGETLQARRRLELDLRQAFVAREFELHYQPLVHLRDQRVAGFEALLRWNRPGLPRVGPQEFIPVAEAIGLIIPLGQWVLETACNEAAGWPGDIAVAVNLSPAQFRGRNVVDAVRDALGRSGLPPARLELEITETVLLNDTDDTLATLHQLRDLGVRISMDDFGTGYSSLSYLLRFPFDKVKIDRSFVRGLGESGDCDAIVQSVTGMCQDLGMATIAEGVETPEQLAVLQERNCTEVQGFLFSPAVPAREVANLLAALETTLSRPRRAALVEAAP